MGVGIFFGCQPTSRYEVSVLNLGEQAFGYQINDQGKLFIQQEFIPAIPCQKHFQSEEDAKAIGQLMVKKIEKKESPSINKKELMARGIDTNCVALPVKQKKTLD